MADNLKAYDPNKGFISFKLDPERIKEELKALIPYYHTLKYYNDNPDAPVSETTQLAAQETPFIGSLLRGDYGDAAQEAILMAMPVKAKKGYVTMPNGKKIKLDKEVIIDQTKTDKYKEILDKANEREWPGAEYEGPGYSSYYAYEDVPMMGIEGKYPVTPREFEAMTDAKYRPHMPTAREANREFKDVLDELASNGDIDRASAKEWYSDYKVDPSDYTAKDAKAYNDMIEDISKGNVYYENLYDKQREFGDKVTNYWNNDKRTKRWKDYKKLKDKYPDAYFNSDEIGTGYVGFDPDVNLTQQQINQVAHDLYAFRNKYGAPDESNLKSAYDFANKVIESRIREPKYEGIGSASWIKDDLDIRPYVLKIGEPNRGNYNNPYYDILKESGEYAVTPKDFNKIVDNARIDNTMAAHRQAIQSYANDVKRGLIDLKELTPQQKLKYNQKVSEILEPIINDTKLTIEQKKALITKQMKGLAREIKVEREFN